MILCKWESNTSSTPFYHLSVKFIHIIVAAHHTWHTNNFSIHMRMDFIEHTHFQCSDNNNNSSSKRPSNCFWWIVCFLKLIDGTERTDTLPPLIQLLPFTLLLLLLLWLRLDNDGGGGSGSNGNNDTDGETKLALNFMWRLDYISIINRKCDLTYSLSLI